MKKRKILRFPLAGFPALLMAAPGLPAAAAVDGSGFTRPAMDKISDDLLRDFCEPRCAKHWNTEFVDADSGLLHSPKASKLAPKPSQVDGLAESAKEPSSGKEGSPAYE